MGVLKFQCDESYDNKRRCMVVAGWIGEASEWKRLENQWERCLERHNARHRPDQQIARFHATELNGFKAAFSNWDADMSRALTADLVKLLNRRNFKLVAAGIDMDALDAEFPERSGVKMESAYGLCIKQVLLSLGHILRQHCEGSEVAFVFESSQWDQQAMEAYTQMIQDQRWQYWHLFQSVTALTWKTSIGLQAADLIAYEAFKSIYNKLVKDSDQLRWAMQQFVNQKLIGEVAMLGANTLKAKRRQFLAKLRARDVTAATHLMRLHLELVQRMLESDPGSMSLHVALAEVQTGGRR